MAPRKKTEEKASANEAADMVLHYLRKSLTLDALRTRDRFRYPDDIQASRIDRTRRLMCLRICITRLQKVCVDVVETGHTMSPIPKPYMH